MRTINRNSFALHCIACSNSIHLTQPGILVQTSALGRDSSYIVNNMNDFDREQYNSHRLSAGGEDINPPQRWSFRDLFWQKKAPETALHMVQEQEEVKASSKRMQRSRQGRRHHSMPETVGVKQAAAVATQDRQQPQGSPMPRCTSIPTHINRLDQSENESSIVSEVTLMTYSEEKQSAVKMAFFQRMRHEQKIRGNQLTMEEKEQLLREVQLEQEHKFQEQEHKFQEQDGNKKQHSDLLERLHALKNMQQQPMEEKTNCQTVQITFMSKAMANSTPNSTDAERMAQEGNMSRPGIRSAKERRRSSLDSTLTTKQGNHSSQGSRIKEEGRRSSLDCSFVTAKQGNILRTSSEDDDIPGSRPSPQEKHEDQQIDHQDDTERILLQAAQEEVLNHTNLSHLHLNQKGNQEQQDHSVVTSSSSSTKNKDAIHELIELKMLVANQQATIDTLSSKLHNLELLQSRQQQRQRGLEVENKKMTSQLNDCREREIQLQNELKLVTASFNQEQEVDDSLNGEREHRQQDLGRINVTLMNENVELRRQLMGMKKLVFGATMSEGTEDNEAAADTTAMAKRRRRSLVTETMGRRSLVTENTVDSTVFDDSIANTL